MIGLESRKAKSAFGKTRRIAAIWGGLLTSAFILSGCGAVAWLTEPGDSVEPRRVETRPERTAQAQAPTPASAETGDKVIRCESRDSSYTTCRAETVGGVRLVRQISDVRCQENRSWGVEDGQIWVDFGCRGDFQLIGTAPPPPAPQQAAAAPNLSLGAEPTAGLQFGTPGRDEAVRACATYADFKVREQGAEGARADRIVHLRKVEERHFQVQAYVRVRYDDLFLRQLAKEGQPRPRDVFYIDCETVRGQVIHFEYNNFL